MLSTSEFFLAAIVILLAATWVWLAIPRRAPRPKARWDDDEDSA